MSSDEHIGTLDYIKNMKDLWPFAIFIILIYLIALFLISQSYTTEHIINTPVKSYPVRAKSAPNSTQSLKAISPRKEAIVAKIRQISQELDYKTPIVAIAIVESESRYNSQAVGDHGTSFGLAQIHLPAHPNVTKEQALDEDFAINFLIINLLKGRCRLWTTCPINSS